MLTRLILVIACLCTLAAPAVAQRRVALVIGNGAYKETAPLPNPRNDAADMITVLKRLGFDVIDGFDLDKRSMERLIRQFEQKLEGAEVGLFFYAGHGIQVSGQNHLLPVDARLSAEGDVDFESLPLTLVLSRMERTVKTSIVLLDACRDNPLARNLARTMGTRGTNIGRGLALVSTGIGTLISFSTEPGNVALDGTERNSPYVTALLKEIEIPGRDIMTTLAAVRRSVVQATNGRQVPWEHTSLLGPVVLKGEAPSPMPSDAMRRDQQAAEARVARLRQMRERIAAITDVPRLDLIAAEEPELRSDVEARKAQINQQAISAYRRSGNFACFAKARYPDSWRADAAMCVAFGCNFGKMSQEACLALGARKQSRTVIHGNAGTTRADECWLQHSCGTLRPHSEFTLFRM